MDHSYENFVQRVRRYRPSQLLATSARASIRDYTSKQGGGGPTNHLDFARAAVCRAAIVNGNEFRANGVSDADLRALCSELVNVKDPFVDDNDVGSFMVRMAYEQFPYQVGPFNDLARTGAMLTESAEESDQEVITPQFWSKALGCSLDEFVGVARLLHAGAIHNEGTFNKGWLSQSNFGPIRDVLSASTVAAIVENHFVVTRDRFRELAIELEPSQSSLKRYAFNPLLVGPFVERAGELPVAPVLRPILYRATPGSLYFVGVDVAGSRFTQALGAAFENYVGRQLRQCNSDQLIPEIGYDKGKKSVDFIVVMPAAVVLVEAKATPLTAESRMGGGRLRQDLDRAPAKAASQIEESARLIEARHSAFKEVPNDRPVLGLVVTMEPYYQCQSDFVSPFGEGSIPKWLCSARELEDLVAVDSQRIDQILLRLTSGSSIGHALKDHDIGENQLLTNAWSKYPFGGG